MAHVVTDPTDGLTVIILDIQEAGVLGNIFKMYGRLDPELESLYQLMKGRG
jgi:hypothetical protein|tara:strand:- start:539 stop:691 length:153 start_codon:yes stop_codon:yes gene_type:complete